MSNSEKIQKQKEGNCITLLYFLKTDFFCCLNGDYELNSIYGRRKKKGDEIMTSRLESYAINAFCLKTIYIYIFFLGDSAAQ